MALYTLNDYVMYTGEKSMYMCIFFKMKITTNHENFPLLLSLTLAVDGVGHGKVGGTDHVPVLWKFCCLERYPRFIIIIEGF